MKTAQNIFKMEYGDSKNFMTPEILKFGKIGSNLVFELSQGTDFENEKIYGVTIVEIKEEKTLRRTDLSKVFFEKGEATKYINKIVEVWKSIDFYKREEEKLRLS